jgi:hypothetical protein
MGVVILLMLLNTSHANNTHLHAGQKEFQLRTATAYRMPATHDHSQSLESTIDPISHSSFTLPTHGHRQSLESKIDGLSTHRGPSYLKSTLRGTHGHRQSLESKIDGLSTPRGHHSHSKLASNSNLYHHIHNIPHDVYPVLIAAAFSTIAGISYFAYRARPLHNDLNEQYIAKLHTEPGKPLRFQNIDDEEKDISPIKNGRGASEHRRSHLALFEGDYSVQTHIDISPIKSSLSTVGFFDIP